MTQKPKAEYSDIALAAKGGKLKQLRELLAVAEAARSALVAEAAFSAGVVELCVRLAGVSLKHDEVSVGVVLLCVSPVRQLPSWQQNAPSAFELCVAEAVENRDCNADRAACVKLLYELQPAPLTANSIPVSGVGVAV